LRQLRGEVDVDGGEDAADDAVARGPVDTPVRHAAVRGMQPEGSTDFTGLKATGTDGLRHGNDA
jgi:hypothetical protein